MPQIYTKEHSSKNSSGKVSLTAHFRRIRKCRVVVFTFLMKMKILSTFFSDQLLINFQFIHFSVSSWIGHRRLIMTESQTPVSCVE